jgi:hypothetical protein
MLGYRDFINNEHQAQASFMVPPALLYKEWHKLGAVIIGRLSIHWHKRGFPGKRPLAKGRKRLIVPSSPHKGLSVPPFTACWPLLWLSFLLVLSQGCVCAFPRVSLSMGASEAVIYLMQPSRVAGAGCHALRCWWVTGYKSFPSTLRVIHLVHNRVIWKEVVMFVKIILFDYV